MFVKKLFWLCFKGVQTLRYISLPMPWVPWIISEATRETCPPQLSYARPPWRVQSFGVWLGKAGPMVMETQPKIGVEFCVLSVLFRYSVMILSCDSIGKIQRTPSHGLFWTDDLLDLHVWSQNRTGVSIEQTTTIWGWSESLAFMAICGKVIFWLCLFMFFCSDPDWRYFDLVFVWCFINTWLIHDSWCL